MRARIKLDEAVNDFVAEVADEKAEQGLLFSLPADIGEAKLTEIDNCIGERFTKLRPNLARAIVALRGMSLPIDKVAYALGLSVHTVLAVENLRNETVEEWRAETAKSIQRSTMFLAQSLMDDIVNGRLKPEQKAFALSVLFNASQLAQGEPTSIHKHLTDAVPAADAWEAYLAGLTDGMLPRIGSGAGDKLTLGAGPELALAEGVNQEPIALPHGLASVSKPLVIEAFPQVNESNDNHSNGLAYGFPSNSAPNQDPGAVPPGGG